MAATTSTAPDQTAAPRRAPRKTAAAKTAQSAAGGQGSPGKAPAGSPVRSRAKKIAAPPVAEAGIPSVTGHPAVRTQETPSVAKPSGAGRLPLAKRVRPNEEPWSAKELKDLRADLEEHIRELRQDLSFAEADIQGLMRDTGNGNGDDQADAGAKTFEREQEMSIANNSRELLEANLQALERLDAGLYGVCEACGEPIGKFRLQAAPRATLCVTCKQKQERR